MPHLHPNLDYTAAAIIVHQSEALFCHHKKLNRWVPIGGHIEYGEHPIAALKQEVWEETGIVVFDGSDRRIDDEDTLDMAPPNFMNLHDFGTIEWQGAQVWHRHLGLYWVVRVPNKRADCCSEHHALAWLGIDDLNRHSISRTHQSYVHLALETSQGLEGKYHG